MRRGVQLAVLDAPEHEADTSRFLAVEHLAEDDRRHRRLRARSATEHPCMAATRVKTELHEAGVEPRPPRGDADVTAESKVHPGADGGAVDRGDRRQRAAGDPQEPLVDAAEAVAIGFGEVA